ncbi:MULTISPECIES: AAA family ATPase [Pantoea]|uniref:AAA family ATPase n=1 Tax=Pantoea TaxID=53335 RepID=UPI0016278B87|nr:MULTISPECIES: ATP-binding protein [Pantoea]MBC0855171.1 ATP-binding protein [Pantoea stewartii]MDJ0088218.1 ATP-binding protein [Pantoea allii]
MKNIIKRITQNSGRNERNILLEGRNLIIVGNNGAGKTIFLRLLSEKIIRIFREKHYITKESLENSLRSSEVLYNVTPENTADSVAHMNNITYFKGLIKEKEDFNVILSSDFFLQNTGGGSEIITRFFEANRVFGSIPSNNHLTSVESLFERFKKVGPHNYSTSDFFETYLVSMSNYALLEKGAEQYDEYARVRDVIERIQDDLRELFEDKSLIISFNRRKLRMEFFQENKNPYDLDQLPAGFSSILAIYAELIMLAELGGKNKNDIQGVVIIDEIDAHLHVTLQKKVFNFFSESFKGIQFIVSTHSPFVVQSVSDAVIYNISTDEQMDDLSLYSFTSIIKGLLGESANSNELEYMLSELHHLVQGNNFDARFSEIVDILEKNVNVLDPKAKVLLLSAKSKFADWSEEGDNV